MAALTSMPVITVATLFLVIVAAMVVQTAATAKPAEDGYAAATNKPVVEQTGGEAAITAGATAKPAEDGYTAATNKPVVKQTGSEAGITAGATAKSAEDNYANAIKITQTADMYAKEAATATSPEKAATAKKVADLLSSMAQTAVALGDKTAKETGVYYVTEKEVEALTVGVKTMRQHIMLDIGEKGSPAFMSLLSAAALLRDAEKNLKSATTATSPEKIVACKKAANDAFISALLHVAAARVPGEGASATTKEEAVMNQPASKEAAVNKPVVEAYAAPKEASPKDAYTAGTP